MTPIPTDAMIEAARARLAELAAIICAALQAQPADDVPLAVALYLAEECDSLEQAMLNLDRVRNFMAEAKDAEHDGDCTKQCHTCLRCLTEGYQKQAEIVAALSSQPSQDVEAMERAMFSELVERGIEQDTADQVSQAVAAALSPKEPKQ